MNYFSPAINQAQPVVIQYSPPQPHVPHVQIQGQSGVAQATPILRTLMKSPQSMQDICDIKNTTALTNNGAGNVFQPLVANGGNGNEVNPSGDSNGVINESAQNLMAFANYYDPNGNTAVALNQNVANVVENESLAQNAENKTGVGDSYEYIHNIRPEIQNTFQQQRVQTAEIRDQYRASRGGFSELCQQIVDILATVWCKTLSHFKEKGGEFLA
ncbi:hypothetical protein RFI_27155 [Reticulomyxa filosa]|uniref:Uncharacterized protein n=1 Tax=Reticulomyxa filosa TaxID=46433 RepID=X6M8H5_RETFI|nr:hypothetical protein RFI_27155 [Reticulomyxa filosa]|eukprot:ETO10219.1 hypothetical protein RFI_27155 [Reticulomyxa filosa]